MNIEALRGEIATAVMKEEAEVLFGLAQGKDVLEIGAHFGFSTILLGSVANHLVSVDYHRQDGEIRHGAFPKFLENLERHNLINEVTIMVAPSERALPMLASRSFDLIFIDGAHDYEAVMRDILNSERLLRAGGTLAFHDYGPVHFGVKEAVDQMFDGHHLDLTCSLLTVTP